MLTIFRTSSFRNAFRWSLEQQKNKKLITSESYTLFRIQNSLSHFEKLLEFARLISEQIRVISEHRIYSQRTQLSKIVSLEPRLILDSGYSLEQDDAQH